MFGRMALPTRPSMPASAPVGSEPFSTVNGRAALEREVSAHLPAAEELADDRGLLLVERQLVDEVAGQPMWPVVGGDGRDPPPMSNESCDTATSPLDGLKISDAVSMNLLHV